jgi:transcriptional regulator with XRE-family HTH domain
MPVPAADVLAKFSPEDRAEIERHAERLIAEYRSLAQIRKALGLTQKAVADALDTSQANVAQIERTPDALVSTLERIVRAMGGELELVASIPGHGRVKLRLGRANGQPRLRSEQRELKIAMREDDLEYEAWQRMGSRLGYFERSQDEAEDERLRRTG